MHKIKNFFGIKKIFLSFLIFFSFFSPVVENNFFGFGGENIVFAEDGKKLEEKSPGTQSPTSPVQKGIVEFIMLLISALTYPTILLLNLVTWALSPSTVFDPNITGTLHQYRVLIKNIILTVSVFILIGIALKQLFKMGTLQELGGKIGMFAVWLILLNFSWFGVKFIIDVGNIATRASFTLYQDFASEMEFVKQGYKVVETPIVNWSPENSTKGKERCTGKDGCKYDLCFIHVDYDGKELYKTLRKTPTSQSCTYLGEKGKIEKDDNAKINNSKLIIVLEKIGTDPKGYPTYDLPSAVIMNFIPMGEFYKISAGTKDYGTLGVETLFSIALAIVSIVTVLGMLIILLQRLVYLWIFLVASPLYFFDKIVNLLTDKNFLPSNLGLDQLLKHAIFIPVGLGFLYVAIALFGGQLFYGNFANTLIGDYSTGNIANPELGTFYQLIIGAIIIVGMWIGTKKIADLSGGMAQTTVNKGMDFMSGFAKNYAMDKIMNMDTGMRTSGNSSIEQKVTLGDGALKLLNAMPDWKKTAGNTAGNTEKITKKENGDFKGDGIKTQEIENNIINNNQKIEIKNLTDSGINDTDGKLKTALQELTNASKNIISKPEEYKKAVINFDKELRNTKNLTERERIIITHHVVKNNGIGEAEHYNDKIAAHTESILNKNYNKNVFNYGKDEDLKKFGINSNVDITEITNKIGSNSEITNREDFGKIIGELKGKKTANEINEILKKNNLNLKINNKWKVEEIKDKKSLLELIKNLEKK